MKHDCLIASGVLGDDVTRLIECVPEKVAILALERALRSALRQHTCAPLVSMAASLGLDVSALPPQRAQDKKLVGGDGANLATEGVTVGLCRPVLARTR
jgi:hypothetical protein